MGGIINVAIRFRDGSAICQARWTNNTPFYFKNIKMFEGDEAFIRDYIDMTRNNDFLADPYAPGRPVPVQNGEYGLIVWDYVTNTILDNNGYSDPVTFDAALAMSKHSGKSDLFLEAAEAGRLRLQTRAWLRDDASNNLLEDRLTEVLSKDEAIKLAEEARQRELRRDNDVFIYEQFLIDSSPMTYIKMPELGYLEENDEDYEAIDLTTWTPWMTKLKEIGFPMTEAEGLNAILPKIPEPREISEQEQIGRELYQQFKSTEEGKEYDRLPFENAPETLQNQMMEKAAALLSDAVQLRSFRMSSLFG